MNQIKNIQYTCVEGKDQIAKFCIVPFEEVPVEIKKYLISVNNKIARNVMPPYVKESISAFSNNILQTFLNKLGIYDDYDKRKESIALVDAFVYPKNKKDKFFYYRVHYIGFDLDRKGSICAISRVLKPAEKTSPNLKTVETVICRKGFWLRNGFAWRQSYLREDIEQQFTVKNLDRIFKDEYSQAYNNHIGFDKRDKYNRCQFPNDEVLYTNRELHRTLLQPLKLKDKTVVTHRLQTFGEFAFKFGPMFVYNNRHTLLPSKNNISLAELRTCICASNDLMWYHDNVNKSIHGEAKIVHVEIEEIKDQELLDMVSFGQDDNYNCNRTIYRKYKKYPGTITIAIVLESTKTKRHLKFTHKYVLDIGKLSTSGLPYVHDPNYETKTDDLLKSLEIEENKNKRRYSLDVLKEALDPLFEKAESMAVSKHADEVPNDKKFNEETTAADEAVYASTNKEDDERCDTNLEEVLEETDHPEN